MNYICKGNSIIVSGVSRFSISDTCNCGQCFRWSACPDGTYEGVAFGRFLKISTDGDTILLNSTEEDFLEIWSNYFDFYTDYESIHSAVSRLHPTLSKAAKFAPGIHILRQDPWETLCSFIFSQNNNITRISSIIKRFCELFGNPIYCPPGSHFHAFDFPSPQVVSSLSLEDLAPLRCGFRAPYILDAARKVSSGQVHLDNLRLVPLHEARRSLMSIRGVGPKVAECTLLYGLDRLEAFPLDIWMKRAMSVLFPGVDPSFFGDLSGISQQYIFHFSRMNPHLFK